MHLLSGHDGVINCLAFTPDAETLISAGKDGTVRAWAPWGDSTVLFVSSERITALAISSDSRYLAIGGAEGSLLGWDLQDSSSLINQKIEGPVSAVAYLPDDSAVAVALGTSAKETSAGSVRFWNWRDRKIRSLPAEISPTTAVRAMAACPSHRLMAWVSQNNQLTIWPITRSSTTRISLKTPCRAIAFSPDGKTLAVTADWKVLLFDIERKQERLTLIGHKGMVGGLMFSPDGRHLLSGSWDKTVKVWSPETGQDLMSFDWPIGRVGPVAYAPDGLRAAAGGDEGSIVVWDLEE